MLNLIVSKGLALFFLFSYYYNAIFCYKIDNYLDLFRAGLFYFKLFYIFVYFSIDLDYTLVYYNRCKGDT